MTDGKRMSEEDFKPGVPLDKEAEAIIERSRQEVSAREAQKTPEQRAHDIREQTKTDLQANLAFLYGQVYDLWKREDQYLKTLQTPSTNDADFIMPGTIPHAANIDLFADERPGTEKFAARAANAQLFLSAAHDLSSAIRIFQQTPDQYTDTTVYDVIRRLRKRVNENTETWMNKVAKTLTTYRQARKLE
jgi:hypothetical protein